MAGDGRGVCHGPRLWARASPSGDATAWCHARAVTAGELVRTYDPARGPLHAWVLGAVRRTGADLARRGLGRPGRAERAEDQGGAAAAAARRQRSALAAVRPLEPSDAERLPTAAPDADTVMSRRRLWRVVEAARVLDAEHARRCAESDDELEAALGRVLPGTLGVLVLAAQADGASLLQLAGQTGLTVLDLKRASRTLADRVRKLERKASEETEDDPTRLTRAG